MFCQKLFLTSHPAVFLLQVLPAGWNLERRLAESLKHHFRRERQVVRGPTRVHCVQRRRQTRVQPSDKEGGCKRRRPVHVLHPKWAQPVAKAPQPHRERYVGPCCGRLVYDPTVFWNGLVITASVSQPGQLPLSLTQRYHAFEVLHGYRCYQMPVNHSRYWRFEERSPQTCPDADED